MHYKLGPIAAGIRGRWLDIGAGNQPYKKYFAGADEYVTTNTKRYYKTPEFEELEKQTTYWIEDAKTLPLPDNSFDGVACFQVLSLIDKPAEFFMEINRVLKPGRTLLLTTDFLFPVWNIADRCRYKAFTLHQLSESNGFSVETIESFGGSASALYNLLMSFIRLFPHLWKSKNPVERVISLITYLLLLILLPIISIVGRLIFLVEKNNTQNTDFTFNLMLKATKKSPCSTT